MPIPDSNRRITDLLLAARASCGAELHPSEFDATAFEAALSRGDLREALDLVDAIADENPAPASYFEALLAAARALEALGHTTLEGNIQYYERMLQLQRGPWTRRFSRLRNLSIGRNRSRAKR